MQIEIYITTLHRFRLTITNNHKVIFFLFINGLLIAILQTVTIILIITKAVDLLYNKNIIFFLPNKE
jgi:hypothetical protein